MGYFSAMPHPTRLTVALLISLTLAAASNAQTTSAPAASTPATAAAPAVSAPAATTPAATPRATPVSPEPTVGPPAAWTRPANGAPLFTDDFESGSINPKMWLTKLNGNATATIVQDNVAHGKNALLIRYPAGRGAYAFLATTLPESLREHFYGRVYMYINFLPGPHSVFLVGGTQGWPAANWLEVGGYNGMFQPSVQRQVAGEAGRGEKVAFEGSIPLNRWFCLEWEFMDKPDRIVLWVDGQLAVNQAFTMNDTNTGLVGGFFEFDLGYRTFAQAAAITQEINVYYDDFAVGDKPIGQLTPVPAKAAPAASATPAPVAKP
jgi:hypothetical protein